VSKTCTSLSYMGPIHPDIVGSHFIYILGDGGPRCIHNVWDKTIYNPLEQHKNETIRVPRKSV
jgi:hypothetical protein